jgi:hypothetical protein
MGGSACREILPFGPGKGGLAMLAVVGFPPEGWEGVEPPEGKRINSDVSGRYDAAHKILGAGARMQTDIFPVLILNALPAAGKSEIIAYLGTVEEQARARRFHVGPLRVLDDFPMLWTWFEEDNLLERVFHRPRLHTTPEGYFLHQDLWHLLIRRLALDYEKLRRDNPGPYTAIIEFSRGEGHGGYRRAYPHLGAQILENAAAMYVRVSFAESLRKNRERHNPTRPDSILEHSLSDDKMRRLYGADDWPEFSGGEASYLRVNSFEVPQVVFDNQDDLTTAGGEPLGRRLEERLGALWGLWKNRPTAT